MPKSKDMGEALGKRFVTQQKVETKDPMQEIMQTAQPAQPDETTQADIHVDKQAHTQAGVDAPVNAPMPANIRTRTHARTHARRLAREKESIPVEALYEKIANRKHLSSSTFRYQSEELEELEEIFAQLDSQKPGRLSRNDIARLGLIWLFEDFKQHGDESVLAQVHRRL